jgi:tetratricopeptide (TPR) repeat protein
MLRQRLAQSIAYWLIIAVCSALFSGCAIFQRGEWPSPVDHVPPQREIASVPFYPQGEYQCGPAALAMGLAWSGLDLKPDDLTDMVYTASRQGSLQPALIAGARRMGRVAYVISGTDPLIREVAAGHPVIVLLNLGLSWLPVWHYAVVIGYDRPADEVVLHSGLNARERMSMLVFQHTWARSQHWGLLVLNPQELPETADEARFVEAVLGLEKARKYEAAVDGYRTALSRWPQNFTAVMGLGNSWYALGNLGASEEAFRRATRIEPPLGAAFNNLAHVLLDLGRRDDALAAARRAVDLSGPLQSVFQKTLEEIEATSP